MKHDDVPDTRHARSKPEWYRSPYLLLPAIFIVFIAWIVYRQMALVAPPATVASAPVLVAGPNLLQNPDFAHGSRAWVVYHNAIPMAVTFDPKGQSAHVAPGSAKDSVQEIYQFFKGNPGKTISVSGEIDISGAALPAGANVAVIVVEAPGKPETQFNVTVANGVGAFPFKKTFVPGGEPKQFVLATIIGSKAADRTIISFKNLSVREMTDVSTTKP